MKDLSMVAINVEAGDTAASVMIDVRRDSIENELAELQRQIASEHPGPRLDYLVAARHALLWATNPKVYIKPSAIAVEDLIPGSEDRETDLPHGALAVPEHA